MDKHSKAKEIISNFLIQHNFVLIEMDYGFSATQIFFIAGFVGKGTSCMIPLYIKPLNVAFAKEWIHFVVSEDDLKLLADYKRGEAKP